MIPKLIILDRDGVINEDSDLYIKSLAEWIPIPGSIEAIALLSKQRIPIAIATNQSGIGRGYYSVNTMLDIHQNLISRLKSIGGKIEHISFCPHLPSDNCICRKPKTGMITEISQICQININKNCYFIGDSLKDIQAATTAGCSPILVKSGKGVNTLKNNPELINVIPVFNNLLEFTEDLLKEI